MPCRPVTADHHVLRDVALGGGPLQALLNRGFPGSPQLGIGPQRERDIQQACVGGPRGVHATPSRKEELQEVAKVQDATYFVLLVEHWNCANLFRKHQAIGRHEGVLCFDPHHFSPTDRARRFARTSLTKTGAGRPARSSTRRVRSVSSPQHAACARGSPVARK
jgi:hypothetical protein